MANKEKPVVLITGCSSGGIGYALCERFAPYSKTVYATGRRLEAMEGFPRANIKVLQLDVSDDESVQTAVQNVLEEEGRIDIVVSNAGTMAIGPVLDIPTPEAISSFNTNFFGTHRLAHACIPSMISRRSGVFMVVGSVTGDVPGPWHGTYSAAKAALANWTEVLQLECAPFGVNVTLIIPGAVKSQNSAKESSRFSMRPGSVWEPWSAAVYKRIFLSQIPGSMPIDQAAKDIVRRAIFSPKARTRLYTGTFTWVYWVLRTLLPRSWALAALWAVQRRN